MAMMVAMAEPLVPRIHRAALLADAVIVVRGDDLDPATSRRQALLFRCRYPDWGPLRAVRVLCPQRRRDR
jgi:hypothetical protein